MESANRRISSMARCARLSFWGALLFLAALFAGACGARAAGDFEAANQLYDQGKFSDARARYESLVRSGQWSPSLFYNLGNCEYRLGESGRAILDYERTLARLGESGRAILDYERTLALQPNHPEAKANLTLLRNKTGAKTPEPTWEKYAIAGVSQDAWAITAAAALWVAAFALAGAVTSRRRGNAGLWLTTVAALTVAAYAGGVLWIEAQDRGTAIVVAKSVEARLAPADSAGLADSLPAGSRVRVLSERGDWIYCELPGEARGWIPQSAIEKVRIANS